MSLTMLGDLAVFWLYVTLICSFLHYTTLRKLYMGKSYSTQMWLLSLLLLRLSRRRLHDQIYCM